MSCVPASWVLIWFVSCPRFLWLWVNYCPAVFVSLFMTILCIYCPVCSAWFHLVYLCVSVYLALSCPALSCPALFGVIKDCHLSYILVPPSCVHRDRRPDQNSKWCPSSSFCCVFFIKKKKKVLICSCLSVPRLTQARHSWIIKNISYSLNRSFL